jgi:dUTP pyrophosphatase
MDKVLVAMGAGEPARDIEVEPLFVQRLDSRAIPPTRAEPGSIGYDLSARIRGPALWIPPKQRLRVPTGLAVMIPRGCYGRVAPRSGLADKHGIDVLAGVIDPSYRGELQVMLYNTGDDAFQVLDGLRIAQLIIERAETPLVVELSSLAATGRGSGGFGSTGR